MVYVPPLYPTDIPDLTDLPDRIDDVDWLSAARYNELKKELRANQIELGTLPKGAYADVKTRLDDGIHRYVDRGDPAAYDFDKTDLTTDATWRDLDISSVVPAGATAVHLTVHVEGATVGWNIGFRKKGNSNAINHGDVETIRAGIERHKDVICTVDSNRVIQYNAVNQAWTTINIAVRGWWI